jgi:osmotically-inducible protein OsmY
LALGCAGAALCPPIMAVEAADSSRTEGVHDEIVIRSTADAALTAKVDEALRDDPYVFADHVSVRTENGVVTVEGTVFSVQDMRRVLLLARRAAGKRRLINRLELVIEDDEGTG